MTHQVAAIGVEEVHPQPACLNFDGPHEFDLNFEPSDLQQHMHQEFFFALIFTDLTDCLH